MLFFVIIIIILINNISNNTRRLSLRSHLVLEPVASTLQVNAPGIRIGKGTFAQLTVVADDQSLLILHLLNELLT